MHAKKSFLEGLKLLGHVFVPDSLKKLGWVRPLMLALLVVNGVSIFGYATFALHPELLRRWEWASRIFTFSYPVFAQLHIWIAFIAFAGALTLRLGARWLPAFFVTCLVGTLSEYTGTSYGIPFGKYEYTHLLGAKFLGKVPYLIPVSWFFMGYASYALLFLIFPKGRVDFIARASRVFWGALLLLSWDLTLDPAMSHLTPFWIWENTGWYYGMPALNLFGWLVTGLVILGAYEVIGERLRVDALPGSFYLAFYMANLI